MPDRNTIIGGIITVVAVVVATAIITVTVISEPKGVPSAPEFRSVTRMVYMEEDTP